MSRMMRFSCLLLAATLAAGSQGATDLPPAEQWVPQDAVICLQVTEPRALVEPLTSERTAAIVKALPAYQKQLSNPKFREMMTVLGFAEVTLGTDWRTALPKLTGGGVTFAVRPNETVLLIVDAEDEDLLKRAHDFLVTMARSDAQNKGNPDQIESAPFMGVTRWTFDGKEAHAMIGRRMVFSNNLEGLKAVLELQAGDGTQSLATAAGYQAAKKAAGSDIAARGYANLGVLKNVPGLAEVLAQDKSNPLTALFFAGIMEAARSSTWLGLGLHVEKEGLTLRALLDGVAGHANSAAAFALPAQSGQGVMPNLSAPRQIAALSFYRDLHRFYAAKDELFPERTSGLIFFENMMGIFFSGRNLTDEVLSETRPEVRFVVAQQQYNSKTGTPEVQIPGFALVLRLRDPEEFDEVAEEAYQKALGLINFTRGQQAQPGLIIDRPVHDGTTFTTAYFSTANLEDKTNVPTRFNVRPSLALPEDYLILSSSEALTRDLIDAVTKEAAQGPKPLAGVDSTAEVSGVQLAGILQANYDSLVRQNMVKEGNTREAAESQVDLLITLARFAKRLDLRIASHDKVTEARLELELNLD